MCYTNEVALRGFLQYVNEVAAEVKMQELSVHLYIFYTCCCYVEVKPKTVTWPDVFQIYPIIKRRHLLYCGLRYLNSQQFHIFCLFY